ncbi:pectate lyase 1-like [Ananas comosus]|uniref:Pectate lyase n=1 Tax=Ananas comosus TaxID=4615 RepID=A0A6P5HI40_ANACO|nr:pectate lyase 1-like [Ananas comosus]
MLALPYADVDATLRGLASRAEGFGRATVGGLHGEVYRVTTLADNGCGSLREGCRKSEPLWIVFEVSGTIHLQSRLMVSSFKTIDGRGQRVKITGKGLLLYQCEHVIVCNLEFEGGRGPDVDAIQIKPNSRHIWIDRCSLRDYSDGLIDITLGSTDVTVSRCRFSTHDKAMLIGCSCSDIMDRCIRVTVHHCFFDGTRQRHPRVRFGKVHLYNNYTRNWGIYAVCASVESQLVSQCNVYEAGERKLVFMYLTEKPADREEGACGCIRSEGDLFLNGAQSCSPGGTEALPPKAAAETQTVFDFRDFYESCSIQPASVELKEALQLCTGWQPIPRPLDGITTKNNVTA